MKYRIKHQIKTGFKDRIKEDRFMLGFVSGLIAAIGMSLLNFIIVHTTAANSHYADFVGIMLFGSKPDTTGEIITAFIAHIFFGGFLGIIFSYLIPLISEEFLLIKAMVYGTLMFFILFSLGVVFKINGLEYTSLLTVMTKSVGSGFYGFVLGYAILKIRYGSAT